MSNWIERYRAGDRSHVWAEMTSLGAAVRHDDTWGDAVAVAHETMRRARTNVERLLEFLPECGYQFEMSLDIPPFVPPPPDVAAQLDRLEERTGRLPLALRCWFEDVGQVNLVGNHPAWNFAYTDPLVVASPIDYVLSEHEEWEAERGTEFDRGVFVVDLAPDYLHKANVSGGPSYAMAVPDEGADGLFLWEGHQTTFVNYLRICFRWGGFPGWDSESLRESWAKPAGPAPTLLKRLAESLLPI